MPACQDASSVTLRQCISAVRPYECVCICICPRPRLDIRPSSKRPAKRNQTKLSNEKSTEMSIENRLMTDSEREIIYHSQTGVSPRRLVQIIWTFRLSSRKHVGAGSYSLLRCLSSLSRTCCVRSSNTGTCHNHGLRTAS